MLINYTLENWARIMDHAGITQVQKPQKLGKSFNPRLSPSFCLSCRFAGRKGTLIND
jgi:hypothetical protein